MNVILGKVSVPKPPRPEVTITMTWEEAEFIKRTICAGQPGMGTGEADTKYRLWAALDELKIEMAGRIA